MAWDDDVYGFYKKHYGEGTVGGQITDPGGLGKTFVPGYKYDSRLGAAPTRGSYGGGRRPSMGDYQLGGKRVGGIDLGRFQGIGDTAYAQAQEQYEQQQADFDPDSPDYLDQRKRLTDYVDYLNARERFNPDDPEYQRIAEMAGRGASTQSRLQGVQGPYSINANERARFGATLDAYGAERARNQRARLDAYGQLNQLQAARSQERLARQQMAEDKYRYDYGNWQDEADADAAAEEQESAGPRGLLGGVLGSIWGGPQGGQAGSQLGAGIGGMKAQRQRRNRGY